MSTDTSSTPSLSSRSSAAESEQVVGPDLDPAWIAQIVQIALDEDLGTAPGRDVTTTATIGSDVLRDAHLVARETGTVAGLAVVPEVLAQVCTRFELAPVTVNLEMHDGTRVSPGDVLARLTGPAQAILIAERTMLNLASRASGVASATQEWTDVLQAARRADGSCATVLDTRKTTPGLRALDKYAVRCGGGTNKRMGLYDVAMVKDNHVVAAGSVSAAIERIRTKYPDVLIQVEADTQAQAIEAVHAGADFLLLDNMATPVLTGTASAVRALAPELGRVELEATGNLTLDRAAEIAGSGVDYLSVGALTHSAPILDLALDLQ